MTTSWPRQWKRRTATVLAVLVTASVSGGLAGCTVAAPLTGAGGVCADWVSFDTPAEAAADAGAVVRGKVVGQDGTVRMLGVEANRWWFDVEEVLERPEPAPGEPEQPPAVVVEPGERIAVVSTPDSCGGQDGVYTEGDPLDPATGPGGSGDGGRNGAGTVVVLLSSGDGQGAGEGDGQGGEANLHLITPFQGVVIPAADGSLPPRWPER